MKYKKKPVVIEAFIYDGDFKSQYTGYYVPDWAVEALESDILTFEGQGDLFVNTLEGKMLVDVGDYVIQGVKGELYPCKPDIFEMTYEKAE